MPYDLTGFITPGQKFEGLDNLTNTLQKNTALKQKAQEDANSKKAASTKYLTNYLSDKDKFTGTKYDPNIHEYIGTALSQGIDLIRKGANDDEVMMAISPLVNKANQYSLNAQQYAAKKKEALDPLKNVKGIDLTKVSDEMDIQAFEGKDLSQVDPTLNYVDMALNNGDVFTQEGFDESYKKAKMKTTTGIIKNTDNAGRMNKRKVKLIGEDYLVSETDADGNHIGFVPKYQIATDGGAPLIHKFLTEKGEVDAPIRLFDKNLFDNLTQTEKAYTVQVAKKYAKANNAELSSKQAENFARAIAYNLKKSRQSGTFETIDEHKEPKQIIIRERAETEGSKKQKVIDENTHDALDKTPLDKNGEIPINRFFSGVTFLTNSRNKRKSQLNVTFNTSDKTFSYDIPDPDFKGEDIEEAPIKREKVSMAEMMTMAESHNTDGNMDFIKGFGTYNRGGKKGLKINESIKPVTQGKNSASGVKWN